MRNKTICIFTIYVANYGAALQTYALCRYLQSLPGVSNVDIVDFYNRDVYKVLRNVRGGNHIKTFLKRALALPFVPLIKLRYKREENFMNSSCTFTEKYRDFNEFKSNIPPYDIYMTGSDQTFNVNSIYSDYFFQNFPKIGERVSYASSMGINEYPIDKVNSIIKLLNGFDNITCRELTASKYLGSILNKPVDNVVDPTLLLSKEQWMQISKLPHDENYLLVYDLNGGESLIQKARDVARILNLEIICLCAKARTPYQGVKKNIYSAGPQEFVGYFQKASFVMTDSFHGTMFSLIFDKPFRTFIAVEKTSSRIRDILYQINLGDCIIGSTYHAERDPFKKATNADSQFKLSVLIEKSKNILQLLINEK